MMYGDGQANRKPDSGPVPIWGGQGIGEQEGTGEWWDTRRVSKGIGEGVATFVSSWYPTMTYTIRRHIRSVHSTLSLSVSFSSLYTNIHI